MLYHISYAIADYEPGAYDDFFDALRDFPFTRPLPTGALLVISMDSVQDISGRLGRLMDPRDTLYVIRLKRADIAGTIHDPLDRFLSRGAQPLGSPYARIDN